MILTLSSQEWIALLGVFCTVLTVVVIPIFKALKKKRDTYVNSLRTLASTTKGLENVCKKIDVIDSDLKEIRKDVSELTDSVQDMKEKNETFETQQLKYMINDAFYSFNNIEEIPDEVLINASQCCDIYVGKGLNHETGARCRLIYEELERRQSRLAHRKQEGDKHE